MQYSIDDKNRMTTIQIVKKCKNTNPVDCDLMDLS